MSSIWAAVVLVVLVLVGLVLAVRIVKQYERGVLFRLGRLGGTRGPGLQIIIPFVDVLHACRCASSRCPSSPKASSPATT